MQIWEEGTDERVVEVLAPFVAWAKEDIVKCGLELEVPFELTWSCYEGGDKPCGKCSTCLDLSAAFSECGEKDPVD